VIFQELSVLPNFTVAQNIMLGDEKAGRWSRKMDRVSLKTEARKTIEHLRFDLDPHQSVAGLSRARQCMVESSCSSSTSLPPVSAAKTLKSFSA
ncbi:MAG: hypothetical protein ACYTBJ_21295, partial [Planctomycetota bacterium]|jgi:ribose transport system ATP-binding protein